MPPNPPTVVVNAVTSVQRAIRRAADLPMPVEITFTQLTNGLAATQVAATVAELKIADVVRDRSVSVEEIAAYTDTDVDALGRLLKAAAAIGLVQIDKTSGEFKLTKLGHVLRSDHPASMRDWAILMNFKPMVDAWGALTSSVRSGKSAFKDINGKSFFDWFGDNSEASRIFSAGMRNVTQTNADTIGKAYPWPQNGVVCDVAGGVGTVLAAVLKSRPDLSGILVEDKQTLAEAHSFLGAAGLAGRVAIEAGDIFDGYKADADVYLLKDVLHDWSDDDCIRIISKTSESMAPGSRLLAIEVLDRVNEPNYMVPFLDLLMFTQTEGGRQRTVDEIDDLFRAGGLMPSGRTFSAVTHTLIEAVK